MLLTSLDSDEIYAILTKVSYSRTIGRPNWMPVSTRVCDQPHLVMLINITDTDVCCLCCIERLEDTLRFTPINNRATPLLYWAIKIAFVGQPLAVRCPAWPGFLFGWRVWHDQWAEAT